MFYPVFLKAEYMQQSPATVVEVSRYTEQKRDRWDTFIRDARNGHFMFLRDYMEYHADRFDDYSLLFEDKGKLLAVLPANRTEDTLCSHSGLTFGGIISGSGMTTTKMLDVFTSLMTCCKYAGISKIIYKAIPYTYHNSPSGEDLYALTINGAQLVRRDVSATLDQDYRLKYSKGTKYNISKARRETYSVAENSDFSQYWSLLGQVLANRHGSKPVHTANEIQRLAELFPQNIRLFEVTNAQGQLMAGTVLYIYRQVVHTQYLANSEEGRQTGALDYLIDDLINRFRTHRYFDFGISTLEQGKILNEGLCAQKEGFGGRAIVHDFYELVIS